MFQRILKVKIFKKIGPGQVGKTMNFPT